MFRLIINLEPTTLAAACVVLVVLFAYVTGIYVGQNWNRENK
jgi:hypothetical protein